MDLVHDIPTLPARPVDGHKGTFGKAVILGGCVGMAGAVSLSGKAGLYSGAGLMRLAVPQGIQTAAAVLCPCATSVALARDAAGKIAAKTEKVVTVLEGNDAIAIGPGLGQSEHLQALLCEVLEAISLPVVIDADGLNNLAAAGERGCAHLASRAILTPHPGEMNRLWEAWMPGKAMPDDRGEQAGAMAIRTSAVVVLKGKGTIITDGNKVRINMNGQQRDGHRRHGRCADRGDCGAVGRTGV